MKKALVLLLTLAMLATMVVGVSAAENTATASITISNAKNGETYSAYKFLDIESQTGTSVIYTVADGWDDFFSGVGATWFTVDGDNKYVTTKGNYVNDSAEVKAIAAAALEYAKDNRKAAKASEVAAGGTVTLANLNLGYYVIDTTVGTILILDTAKANETIEDKNFTTTIDKKVGDEANEAVDAEQNVAIGDTVYYTIEFVAQAGHVDYVVTDKMDAGLSLKADTIAVAPADLVKDTDYEIVTTGLATGETFKVVFKTETAAKIAAADKKVTITYQATVNENAVIDKSLPNKAELKYGQQFSEDSVTVKTYDVNLKKVNEAHEQIEDAVFSFKLNGNVVNLIKVTDNEYRLPKANETGDVATFKAGNITVKGLDLDKLDNYAFVEVAPPAGYNKVDGDIEMKANFADLEVVNKTGTELPETGGAGTVAFTVVGSLLMLAAVVLFTAKKKMSVQG
ncbi:MAG: isopeptide-forming domain-containing fimbrial protein [Clostridia bacterium]|nr:isopeptide-forming domain-containing fimbrial protein [Clostridia bacterium]